ncbi:MULTISPECIES: phosphatidate cytidylyltransferase [unclassified Ruegeria]|uniref:phosphatidate cytidylyltransferase n=1 Tax=unclassified Ruegeria TaxID=2625375 RepID=UPI00148772C8|nr:MULTISPECIES: phosphatidate cytidylyltransferase [unclassified Ruegeria]NOD75480.1 phosphatidate cytidylyltransferase [Ruegeria sp. HKCCD4332]NOD87462.1 phosphatidate cytidylyltransferase [Ruegeria sp. HKCCD4318]NOE13017.1 phosphatidate cytidylyltransferase [Ruegeria sp. HKCCD4318-2]NOG08815.1 phosphatidate cytidylyltransferase [Ruegeria sp. HKCCD4315]
MSEGRWSDLTARVLSAAVLVLIGAVEVWLGGIWFEIFIAVACGLMTWELVRMIEPNSQSTGIQLGILTSAAVLLSYHVPPLYTLPVVVAPALVGMGQMSRSKILYGLFAVWIVGAGLGFISIRENFGFGWMVWLIAVVVATDVAGYFVGKTIGGPKFWPRVSPKKTWSGTAGGWAAAACVGIAFATHAGFGFAFVVVSVLASMASQIGDIIESAVKRKFGVKDSSNLIPGHGGFLDRFDGMMGAALFVLIAGLFYAPGGM